MIYLSLKGFLRMYLKKCPQLFFGKKKKAMLENLTIKGSFLSLML